MQQIALRIQHDKRERMAKVVALDAPAAARPPDCRTLLRKRRRVPACAATAVAGSSA